MSDSNITTKTKKKLGILTFVSLKYKKKYYEEASYNERIEF